MPLTQPKRHNPLMLGYFEQLEMTSANLAHLAGVSRSQVVMARTRSVGPDNGRKIVHAVGQRLGLSPVDRLLLFAEIRGYPASLVLAFFGSVGEIERSVGIDTGTAGDIAVPGRPISVHTGKRLLERLREMDAPEAVAEEVRFRIRPRPGERTHQHAGKEMARQRKETRESLSLTKPRTAQAIERSGLSRRELHERAGIGRETLRRALYGPDRTGRKTVEKIVAALELSGEEAEDVRAELIS